jgi:hypothetical protein
MVMSIASKTNLGNQLANCVFPTSKSRLFVRLVTPRSAAGVGWRSSFYTVHADIGLLTGRLPGDVNARVWRVIGGSHLHVRFAGIVAQLRQIGEIKLRKLTVEADIVG